MTDETNKVAWITVTGPVTVTTPGGLSYEIAEDITLKVPIGSKITHLPSAPAEWAGQDLPDHLEP